MGLMFLLLLGLMVVFFVYMLSLAHKDHVDYHMIHEPLLSLRSKFTIFFISDIHNRVIKEKTIERIKEIDCVIIGGDLIDQRVSIDQLTTNIMRLQRWGAPVYFVPGNNDHELKEDDILRILKEYEVQVLSNVDKTIPSTPCVTISGIDPYFMMPGSKSTYVNSSEQLQILIVHDPYVFKQMDSKDQLRFNLILSGHTHGGQIRLFGIGPYKRGGWFKKGESNFLVSEGYGTSLVPFRLGTKAECHVIELVQENVH